MSNSLTKCNKNQPKDDAEGVFRQGHFNHHVEAAQCTKITSEMNDISGLDPVLK